MLLFESGHNYRWLRKEDWLPRSSREKSKKLEEEIAKLEQTLMRHATPEEIADHMGISVDEVYQTDP